MKERERGGVERERERGGGERERERVGEREKEREEVECELSYRYIQGFVRVVFDIMLSMSS